MLKMDGRTMRIVWVQEMNYIPALRTYLRKGEVMEVPKIVGDNLILQGFAVKHKLPRTKTFVDSAPQEMTL